MDLHILAQQSDLTASQDRSTRSCSCCRTTVASTCSVFLAFPWRSVPSHRPSCRCASCAFRFCTKRLPRFSRCRLERQTVDSRRDDSLACSSCQSSANTVWRRCPEHDLLTDCRSFRETVGRTHAARCRRRTRAADTLDWVNGSS